MTEFVYNVDSLNSDSGTAHVVADETGTIVTTDCGLTLRPLTRFDTDEGDEPTGKCGNCDWGDS